MLGQGTRCEGPLSLRLCKVALRDLCCCSSLWPKSSNLLLWLQPFWNAIKQTICYPRKLKPFFFLGLFCTVNGQEREAEDMQQMAENPGPRQQSLDRSIVLQGFKCQIIELSLHIWQRPGHKTFNSVLLNEGKELDTSPIEDWSLTSLTYSMMDRGNEWRDLLLVFQTALIKLVWLKAFVMRRVKTKKNIKKAPIRKKKSIYKHERETTTRSSIK